MQPERCKPWIGELRETVFCETSVTVNRWRCVGVGFLMTDHHAAFAVGVYLKDARVRWLEPSRSKRLRNVCGCNDGSIDE